MSINMCTLCLIKNVPPLQLAIIFTYTVRLRHKCCWESRQSKNTLFSHHT